MSTDGGRWTRRRRAGGTLSRDRRGFCFAAVLSAFSMGCGEPADPGSPAPLGAGCVAPALQHGTATPCEPLATRPSAELAHNRIGSVAEAGDGGDWVWDTGLKWMRLVLDPYGDWQAVDWVAGEEYVVDPVEEAMVDALVAHGVKVMIVLDIWHPAHRTAYHKTDEDIATYLSWVRFMVRYFRGRVHWYEILNEPDLNFAAPSGMPVDAYVHLVERTVPVIREEDPSARIVVGAVPDTRFDHVREWMWGVLASDAMALVDGFSWHPMYGAAPSDDPRGIRDPEAPQMANYWDDYPALVADIRAAAEASGFEGEYLVEEMLWRTPLDPHPSEPYGFTDVTGAKYYARAMVTHLGLDVATGVAFRQGQHGRPRSHDVIRALSTVMAGAAPAELPVVVETGAERIRHHAFEHEPGAWLVAIWSDGPAAEDDPVVEAAVVVPGAGARAVTGIDPLQMVEQPLHASVRDSDLVVARLVVRDYPVILRMADPAP